jgi:NTE family protein
MPIDTNKLTNDPGLVKVLNEVRALIQQPEHAISDVVDAEGNQYVDIVMEGGGMLGLALVGYTWALEEMGIRFLGIGGTSAGSINALLLAAMDDPANKKSPKLLNEMANLDFYRFVDGDGTPKGRGKTRDFIELALNEQPMSVWKGTQLMLKYWGLRKQLIHNYGINKGDEFRAWLAGLLATAGIRTNEELQARMAKIPPLMVRSGREPPAGWKPQPGKLVIIASDVTTETRVELPIMADMYWRDVDKQNPADFARASMSIPFFFETMRVTNLPDSKTVKERWNDMGIDLKNENGDKVPDHILFVDGGLTSNFPIDAFHVVGMTPLTPTFGVKLEYDNRYKPPTALPLYGAGGRRPLMSLSGALFNSSRHTLDYEFIKKNPDYKHLVKFIPCTYSDPQTGKVKNYNWLDFNMPTEHREGLFKQGAHMAIEFVREFAGPVDEKGKPIAAAVSTSKSKWEFYKKLRSRLA